MVNVMKAYDSEEFASKYSRISFNSVRVVTRDPKYRFHTLAAKKKLA
jgi:hypothetical protein